MTSPPKNPNQFTFWEHLDEVRIRILRLLAIVSFFSIIAYSYSGQLLDFFIAPVGKLVFTAPADAFVARLTLTFTVGILASIPFILFELWTFISVALKDGERKLILYAIPFSIISFFVGALFAYGIVIPFMIKFFMGFATESMIPMITVKSYISFVASIMLSFGVIFQLPLLLMFFTYIGIATPEFLIQKRRHAIMIILIVSAIITPPDGMTLIMMSVPLIVLYEIGVIVSKIVYKQSLKSQQVSSS